MGWMYTGQVDFKLVLLHQFVRIMLNTMNVAFRLRYPKATLRAKSASANKTKSRKDRTNPEDATVYVRVELSGKEKDLFSTKIKAPAGRWDFVSHELRYDKKKVNAALNSPEYQEMVKLASIRNININALLPDSNLFWLLQDEEYTMYLYNKKLRAVKNKLLEIENRYNALTKPLSFDVLLSEYYGEVSAVKTLKEVSVSYLASECARVGEGISKGTYKLAERYTRILNEYLTHTRQRNILISQVGYTFANEFRNYLLKTRGYNGNYVTRTVRYFKQIAIFAQANGWMSVNTTTALKLSINKKPKQYGLEPHEVDRLYYMWANQDFGTGHIADTVQAFLFCCHTGLAYTDYSLLNPKRYAKQLKVPRAHEIVQPSIDKVDGVDALIGRRIKTNTPFCVPIGKENYFVRESIVRHGSLQKMPVFSNSDMNKYLKIVGALAGIKLKMDFHLARKTFANYLLNYWRIPAEVVIGIMGWRDIKECEPYTKIENERIVYDFKTMQPRPPAA